MPNTMFTWVIYAISKDGTRSIVGPTLSEQVCRSALCEQSEPIKAIYFWPSCAAGQFLVIFFL